VSFSVPIFLKETTQFEVWLDIKQIILNQISIELYKNTELFKLNWTISYEIWKYILR